MSVHILAKTGKANAETSMSECYVFYCPTAGSHVDKEDFLGKIEIRGRAMPIAPVISIVPPIVLPSLTDYPLDIGGQYGVATYGVHEGAILKLVTKYRGGWNATMSTCVTFVRIRATAAWRRISHNPTLAGSRSPIDWMGIDGRFDILTLEEAEAFGIFISEGTRRLYQVSDRTICDYEERAPEEDAPVTLKTIEGTNKKMVVVKRRRKLEDV